MRSSLAASLVVLLVMLLEIFAGIAAGAQSAAPAAPPPAVVLYFDTALATPESLAAAALAFANNAEGLVALGEVEVVLADPLAEPLAGPTRDASALRRALELVGEETAGAGELFWLRNEYQEELGALADGDGGEEGRRSVGEQYLRDEQDLLNQFRDQLLTWVGAPDRRRAGYLFLVQDGFELDPEAYYLGRAAPPAEAFGRALARDLARRLKERGWVAVALALGVSRSPVRDPEAALEALVVPTGGEVVTRAQGLSGALVRLASGRTEAPAPEVASAAAPPPVLPPPPTAGSGTSVIRLLPPRREPVVGKTRLRALVSTSEVAKVVFFIDGQEAATDARPPFAVTLELADPAKPQEIRGVAYSAGDRRLGEDTLFVNQVSTPFRVNIAEVEVGKGALVLRGEVSVPPRETLDRVEIYLNETLVRRQQEPTFDEHIEAPQVGPEDFVRVVAHLASGESLEDVRLLAAPGTGERLEVNLVELFTVVTDEEGSPVKDLQAEDFALYLKGKPQELASFRRADDVPLVLGLLVDTSESMWVLLPDTKKAAARFLSQTLIEGDQAFLVEFDTQPRLVQGITGDLFEILQRFGSLRAKGVTALYDSIVFSLLQFEGARGRRALVLLTDGEDFGSQLSARRCVQYGKELGVPVYILSLVSLATGRPSLPKSDLDWITRNTGGRTYYVETLEQLDEAYAQINAELRSQYILAYAPGRELTEKELASLDVKVKRKGLTVRTVVGAKDRR